METSDVRQAVIKETAIEHKIVNGEDSGVLYKKVVAEPAPTSNLNSPTCPTGRRKWSSSGFSEVGPWGNSRTRWEMESKGKFSLEGCVEMAWIMGLIKHHNGPLKGQAYSGWVDAKTGEPVDDKDIKAKYEKHILEHTGIRLIEPELFKGYDPKKKQLLQEIVIQEDLEPFESSKETAEEFKREHGDKVEIFEIPESGEYTVRLRKGATMLIPKALQFDRLVAGQVPTGWDASRYGIPDEFIEQVDPVTLFVLVCTAEAMLSAGITDPYEFYKCLSIVIGSVSVVPTLCALYKDLRKPLHCSLSFNLYWSHRCLPGFDAVVYRYETIVEGKARVCSLVVSMTSRRRVSYEFANMKATSNAEDEFAHGRTPQEMSRPTTTTRAGFMESQGCGMQLIMTAQLALDMGVPIHGIIALTTTATDKIGRSVPAPGQGVLTTARENPGKFPSPLLDIKYRRRQLDLRKKQINEWQEAELLYLQEEADAMKAQSDETFNEAEYMQERAQHIEREAIRQEKDAQYSLGNNFWKQDPRIAPLRGAMATWGLTVDDIDIASFHGTSTVANDKNESDVICQQMKHLGRTKGNAIMGIFQKYLTGHPKGAAGAWMFNGCLQVLDSGLVPGNRNADNVDKVMEKFDYIVYPSRSIQTDGVKAFSVTSFGFGQKGAQVIGIHPKYLYATLDQAQYQAYRTKVEARQKKAYRYFHNGLINNSIFVAKTKAPYEDALQSKIFLNPDYRVSVDKKTSELKYSATAPEAKESESTRQTLESLTKANATENSKVGVDVEHIDSVNIENETFVERNFTQNEQDYCRKAASPQSSFAGRWSAKEAVFKSLGVSSKGAGAALKDIEIGVDANGAPVVNLHGAAAAAAKQAGVKKVSVSISHSDSQAVAVAVSQF
ncbi:hypothetical protein PDIDSM_6247 [Penicillium digitatum]|nr:hypothetical protein PDIDSM_6247 [Penicillium digitatum]